MTVIGRLITVYFRGMAMGAADVVPGVSGGTVAFITGIYEELIHSLKAIDLAALKILFRQGPLACWQAINGNFLLALGLGILTSIASLARLIVYLLDAHPLLVWAFFFGLIVASSLYIARQIAQWRWSTIIAITVGALLAIAIAQIKPAELPPELWIVFLAGAVAICAMVLPGISGSFILVLMGMYRHIMGAIEEFNWLLLVVFMAGCGVGLLSFVHLLSWLLRRFHDWVMAVLTGFLAGSLYMVWPWKEVVSFYQNSKGQSLALQQSNVWPSVYQSATGLDPQTLACVFFAAVGVIVVLILEQFGQKTVKTSR